jgi:hypothetical protein
MITATGLRMSKRSFIAEGLSAMLALLSASCALGAAEAGPSPNPKTNDSNTVGPQILFASTGFNWGKVESGDLVKHSFVFTNGGDQTLEIRDVRTSCGCTTSGSWDRRVEPGQTGQIPIQFNSSGFAGWVLKSVTVVCNDPARSNAVLQLAAEVWKPLEVSPPCAVFNIGPDMTTNQVQVLRITSNLEESVTLSEPTSSDPAFRTELKTIKPGKAYDLAVSMLPPGKPGTLTAVLGLKTSYAKAPVLNISAYAYVLPVLAVVPANVQVSPGPLAIPVTLSFTVLNNSTNLLVLSEPGINVPGADLQIREVQSGRQFQVDMTLPAGFDASTPGLQVEARLKSNDPRVPELKVPVLPKAAATR